MLAVFRVCRVPCTSARGVCRAVAVLISAPSPCCLPPAVARRSSKVAVALAAGGLVPPLLEPLMAAVSGQAGRGGAAAAATAAGSAPILRAKLLDIISIMYQHHPRPKEFIMKYRIQVSKKML